MFFEPVMSMFKKECYLYLEMSLILFCKKEISHILFYVAAFYDNVCL